MACEPLGSKVTSVTVDGKELIGVTDVTLSRSQRLMHEYGSYGSSNKSTFGGRMINPRGLGKLNQVCGKFQGACEKANDALRKFGASTPIRSYSSTGFDRLPRKLKKRMSNSDLRRWQSLCRIDKIFKKWTCSPKESK